MHNLDDHVGAIQAWEELLEINPLAMSLRALSLIRKELL